MKGVRRHGAGWQAEVRVRIPNSFTADSAGVRRPAIRRSIEQFPLDTPERSMQAWRKDEKARLRLLLKRGGSGTFSADATKYLRARAAMRTITDRTRHINIWVALFGDRRRDEIQAWEIAAVRDRWLLEGPQRLWRRWTEDCLEKIGGRYVDVAIPLSPSQVNNRLRALENLWTVLDGPKAPNPVRDAGEAEMPEAEARGLAYELIEAILHVMPNRGQGRKDATRTEESLTKWRLRAFAYIGLAHNELRGIREEHCTLDTTPPTVWIAGRRKGKGTKGVTQPLTQKGADVLRNLIRLKALGQGFSGSSIWKSFRRACRALAPDGTLDDLRPYDLRHSFATEMLSKTEGNLSLTQLLMRHKDQRTTRRYSERAVHPAMVAAIALVEARGGFCSVSPDPALSSPEAGALLAHSAPEQSGNVGRNREPEDDDGLAGTA